MNIQTERLENHMARLTVELELPQWEKAKEKAARSLSNRYKIPGFRKGKAPYNIVLRFLGEQTIIEATVEQLGNEVYRDALDQSGIQPYTSGSLENFKLEPQPTYIFQVPLQPEVDLGAYRDTRLEFTAPEVTEEEVDQAMRRRQQQQAVVEDIEGPVQIGNRVTIDLHSQFADGEEPAADDADDDDDAPAVPAKGDDFLHRHDAVITLDPELEPVLPGFNQALAGAEVNTPLEFELTVPSDDVEYTDIAGRKVQFNVVVKKIQAVTLPELTDEFAAEVTKDEDEPLNLLQLRDRVREELQKQTETNARTAYADRVLDSIVTGATVAYPDAMVSDRVHEILHDMDNSLRQQGASLETYQKITGITHEQLHEQYHEDAVRSLRRSLVLGELMLAERIRVTAADIDAQIDEILVQFGEQAASLREFIDTPQQRESIANNLLYQRIMDRLAQIGKGEAPDAVVDETVVEEGVSEEAAPADNSETSADQ